MSQTGRSNLGTPAEHSQPWQWCKADAERSLEGDLKTSLRLGQARDKWRMRKGEATPFPSLNSEAPLLGEKLSISQEIFSARDIQQVFINISITIFHWLQSKIQVHKVHRAYNEEGLLEPKPPYDSVSPNLVSTRFSRNLTLAYNEYSTDCAYWSLRNSH